MDSLIVKRAAVLKPSAHNFRIDNRRLGSPSCVFILHSSCSQGSNSSRRIYLHYFSRCLSCGHYNEGCRISEPWPERRSGLTRRANPERIDLLCSDDYEARGEEEEEAGAVGDNLVTKVVHAFGDFVNANFLIVGLSSSVLFGLVFPAPGRAAQQMGLTKWCTSAIFLLSGLNIRSSDAEQGVAAWRAGVLGLVSILIITPLAAIPILSLQSSPRELVAGLAIFACVPTTLSSAVCLTQIAGANVTLAIGLTVLSNLISTVTMPFTLTALVGGGIGVSIAPNQLLRSLIQTLLVPLVLGKIIRETFSGIADLVDGNRRQVSMLTASFQSLVPWMQLSTSRAMLLQIEPSNLVIITAAGLALHLAYLTTNFILTKVWPSHCLRDRYNSRAIMLVASQKSIVVSIAVIDRLGGAFGNAGLLVLPCIAAQFSQVLTDSILVQSWLRSDERERLRIAAEEAQW